MTIGSSLADVAIRTGIIYLVVVLGLKLLGKKELSQISIVDLVFILLISNAVQNAMVGDNTSLEGGVIAAVALLTINFILRYINYRSSRFRNVIEGEPVLLIYEGSLVKKHLEREKITLEELMAVLREHGVADIKDVKLAMLEIDGNISVVSKDFVNKTKHKKHIKGFFKQ